MGGPVRSSARSLRPRYALATTCTNACGDWRLVTGRELRASSRGGLLRGSRLHRSGEKPRRPTAGGRPPSAVYLIRGATVGSEPRESHTMIRSHTQQATYGGGIKSDGEKSITPYESGTRRNKEERHLTHRVTVKEVTREDGCLGERRGKCMV